MNDYNPYDGIKDYTIGDSKTLKIGVIGDTQLISLSHSNNFYLQFSKNCKKSLDSKLHPYLISKDIILFIYEISKIY